MAWRLFGREFLRSVARISSVGCQRRGLLRISGSRTASGPPGSQSVAADGQIGPENRASALQAEMAHVVLLPQVTPVNH
jgi:hypothetical protein